MSIDFSVLIWTVINFLITMVLLNLLLYRPLRSFMRSRDEQIKEGIAAGKAARDALEAQMRDYEAQLQNLSAQLQLAEIDMQNAVAVVQEQAFERAEAEAAAERERLKAEMQIEEAELMQHLDAATPQMLAFLARQLGAGHEEEEA